MILSRRLAEAEIELELNQAEALKLIENLSSALHELAKDEHEELPFSWFVNPTRVVDIDGVNALTVRVSR